MPTYYQILKFNPIYFARNCPRSDQTASHALNLLEETYNRWWVDALGRSDMVTVTKVMFQRETCFPTAVH